MNDIAINIAQQIGHSALYMLGSNKRGRLMATPNGVVLKIAQNHKGVNRLKIELNGADLYDVSVYYERFMSKTAEFKVSKHESVNNVHVENLHSTIESLTGLYTSI